MAVSQRDRYPDLRVEMLIEELHASLNDVRLQQSADLQQEIEPFQRRTSLAHGPTRRRARAVRGPHSTQEVE
jgi:hypothetical protein